MRTRIIMVLCLLTIAGGIYYATSEKDGQDVQPMQKESVTVVSDESDVSKQDPINKQDLKRQQMTEKFADLKEIRKKMKMRLSRLSSRLRRSEFLPEQAKTISQDMRRASYLLKNPKLLGAFSDLREIEDEIGQLSEINVKLDAIKKSLDEKRKNKS